MSIFPFINGQAGTEELDLTSQLPIFEEIAWDFNKDSPIFENGDFKILKGKEALKVWIYKTIKTDRFELDIYSWNYGSEVNNLVSTGYSKGLTESESKRYIKEALLISKYINDVRFIKIEFIDNVLILDIDVETIYGNAKIKL